MSVRETDIGWADMHVPTMLASSCAAFAGIRAGVHPLFLLRTRLQAQRGRSAYAGAISGARAIVATEGVRGLYKGLGAVLVGVVPAQTLYISTYEGLRSAAGVDRGLAAVGVEPGRVPRAGKNAIAALAASMVSLVVAVPVDVVSQRMQMQSAAMRGASACASSGSGSGSGSSSRAYASAAAVVVDTVRNEGLRGLYRGTAATMLSSVPSSGVWWGSYTVAKPWIASLLGLDPSSTVLHTVAGLFASFAAATATNPLDVIRTRIQVDVSAYEAAAASGARVSPPTIWSTAQSLLAQESVLSMWTKGLVPRLWSSSIMGVIMVVAYEKIKAFSVVDPTRP